MKSKFSRVWLAGTVFSACTFGLVAGAAAQTTPSAEPATKGLATITVTARKKSEDVQKVPLTIAVISAHTLKQAHVENLHDLLALTPGIFITDTGAETNTSITIHGITDQTFGVGVPDVATFLDGQYLRDTTAINIAAIPLSNVSVVKNPSSALYGRDAYSGVILYTAQRPTTTPHADISETAGDFGKSELQADASGPLIGDKVLGEVFGDFDTFNGTYKDKVSGATGGSYQKKDFGGLLDINWASNISTHVDFYYGDDYFGNTAVETLTPNCEPNYTPAVINGAGYLVDENSQYCGKIKTNGTVDIANTANSDNPGNVRRTFFITGTTQAVYDWGTLSSTTGASQIDERAYQQFDAGSNGSLFLLVPDAEALSTATEIPPSSAATSPGNKYAYLNAFYGGGSNTGNFSQEFRYTSPQAQPIRYGAGGSFYSETRFASTDASFADGSVPAGYQVYSPFNSEYAPYGINDTATWGTSNGQPGPNYNLSIETTDEESGFANVEADLIPTVTVSSEYRYTWSLENFSEIYNQYDDGKEYPDADGDHIHKAAQYFTSNEAIKWNFMPQDMVYFAFANGVKPGGFNGASTTAADASFGPETDLNYEGGIKSTVLDNRLQLDAAVYHIDTQGLQAYGPGSDPTNVATVIKNYGATTNTGFEIDARALPIDGLTVTGGFNYNNPTFVAGTYDEADYQCFSIPSCDAKEVLHPVDGGKAEIYGLPEGGGAVQYSPKYTFSGTFEYDWTVLDQFPAYVRGDVSYKSSVYTNEAELESLPGAFNGDVFAGISKDKYTLSVYVKNISNDETPSEYQSQVQLSNFQNVGTVDLPDGRTFAFTIAAKF
jgi:iron complex outermembrane receptor protein